jgi:hypothetical protein
MSYARRMRVLRAVVAWLLPVVGAVSAPAGATPPAPVVSVTQASLLAITESTRYKLMTDILRTASARWRHAE